MRLEHGPQALADDLVVVDEASMLDVPLMQALMRAIPPHAAFILVGDVDHTGPDGVELHRRRCGQQLAERGEVEPLGQRVHHIR